MATADSVPGAAGGSEPENGFWFRLVRMFPAILADSAFLIPYVELIVFVMTITVHNAMSAGASDYKYEGIRA